MSFDSFLRWDHFHQPKPNLTQEELKKHLIMHIPPFYSYYKIL